MMKVYIASDFNGFQLKEEIKNYIEKEMSEIQLIDKGCN